MRVGIPKAIVFVFAVATSLLGSGCSEDSAIEDVLAPRAPVLLSMSGVGGAADLWLVDVTRGTMRNLTTSVDDEFNPSWSPDGRRIVYARQYTTEDAIGGDDLFVLDVETGRVEPLRVAEGDEEYPAWSPDGSRIAFVSDHEFVLGAIYTIKPDGSGLRLVGARGRMPESLTWSPEGNALAFISNVGSGDDQRVHVMDADGGVARPVSAGEIDVDAVWSPRTDEVLFIRGFEVRAVDVGSGDERSLRISGLLAGWYDEHGSIVVADSRNLIFVPPGGEPRKIATLRGLVYSPPAPRP